MSDLEDFIEFVTYARRHKVVGPRRYLRDYSDPFTKYSVQEFHARYRFTPDSVKNVILPLLLPDLRKATKRGLSFAPEIMLLLSLRYFATGRYQKMEEDVMGICQQSASRIITQISNLIARQMKDFVKFPSTAEGINTVKQQFYDIAHFPGVIGCIDCTHIKIRSPGSDVYRNNKGWFSINIQAVTGPNMEFYDLVARWPGSTHDNFVYNSSTLKQRLDSGVLNGIILGDNGYAVSNVLLTPFQSPNTPSQEHYNKSLLKTRNTIERCFGIWKRRFPCLQVGMGVKLETSVAVICACAALHNMAVMLDGSVSSNYENHDNYDNVEVAPIYDNPNSSGFIVRQSLVERIFTKQ